MTIKCRTKPRTEHTGGVSVVFGLEIGPRAFGSDDRRVVFGEVVVHEARGADVVLQIVQ